MLRILHKTFPFKLFRSRQAYPMLMKNAIMYNDDIILAFSFKFSASLAIVAASLFALQTDDRASSFVITRGEAFYMQVRFINTLFPYQTVS